VDAVKPLVLSAFAKYASQSWLFSDSPEISEPEAT